MPSIGCVAKQASGGFAGGNLASDSPQTRRLHRRGDSEPDGSREEICRINAACSPRVSAFSAASSRSAACRGK
jgi:hypothetical protein